MTTTTKELIARHNTLAMSLGRPELTGWKQSKEALAERVDAMEACLAQDTDAPDNVLRADAEDFVAQVMTDPLATDPLDLEAAEKPSATETDTVSPMAAEEPGDDHAEPAAASEPEARGGIGRMIADLLVDEEGYAYGEIVDIVRGEFPEASTSKRSIASVAAALRRKGIEVPMRRKAKA